MALPVCNPRPVVGFDAFPVHHRVPAIAFGEAYNPQREEKAASSVQRVIPSTVRPHVLIGVL